MDLTTHELMVAALAGVLIRTVTAITPLDGVLPEKEVEPVVRAVMYRAGMEPATIVNELQRDEWKCWPVRLAEMPARERLILIAAILAVYNA